MVLRKALLTIVYFIDEKYSLEPPNHYRNYFESKFGYRLKN